MISFDFDEYCSGCGACANVCPRGAIILQENVEGFMVPTIKESKCVSCGQCENVCIHLNAKKTKKNKSAVCGAWLYSSENIEAKMRSASGAAFYELASGICNEGGWQCGCVWDENLHAMHIVGNDEISLRRMQGSKYLQSNVGDIYMQVREILKRGEKIIFSGTPCQALAAHEYIMNYQDGKYRENLLTVGVLCHGVASPFAWESYKKWTNRENGSSLISVNFRDKSKEGYGKSYCRYEYENGTVIYLPTYLPSSKYIEATLVYNLAIRKSCAHCDCKGVNIGIDLILGDWYAACEGEGALGTSCVVAFTNRGKTYAKKYLKNLREIAYADILRDNEYIQNSVKLGRKRKDFMEQLSDNNLWDKVEKFYPHKYKYKKLLFKMDVYWKIKNLYKLLKKCFNKRNKEAS